MNNIFENRELLMKIVRTRMPYGKYKGWLLLDLPEPYLSWYNSKGFPAGKMGEMLNLMYEVKLNGLEGMLKKLL